MKTPTEIYALLEAADPVADAEPLDTSALIARIETELGHAAASPSAVPIREESITHNGTTARPVTPKRRWWSWRGPGVAVGTAVIIVGAVLGVAAAAGVFDTEGDLANTGTTTIEDLPPAVITLSAAPDLEPVGVSTVIGDLEFTTLRFPPDHGFDVIAATPYGPVAIGDSTFGYDTLWWSTDYRTWESVDVVLDSWPGQPSRVTVGGDDVFVPGSRVRLAWDGTAWAEQTRLKMPDRVFRVDQLVFGPRGAVALSGSTIYYSTDGLHFTEAEQGPSKDLFVAAQAVPDEDFEFADCRLTAFATASRINAVLATDAGYVALTSAIHPHNLICQPLLWFSSDGNTWEVVSHDSPFGEVDDIAAGDSRFVANGSVGEPWKEQGTEPQEALWVSDDGLTWQRSAPELGDIWTVTVGELGWALTGRRGPENAEYLAMWFSPDGLTWDGPHHLPEGLTPGPWGFPPSSLAVGSDAIFGVGAWPGTETRTLVVGRLQDQGG